MFFIRTTLLIGLLTSRLLFAACGDALVDEHFPKGLSVPKFSFQSVQTRGDRQSFVQEEVPLVRFPLETQARMQHLMELAGDGYLNNFVEAGFFAAVTADGKIIYSDRVTSNDSTSIAYKDLDPALEHLLTLVESRHITRVQFFHTHPKAPSALEISRNDMEAVVKWSADLLEKGISVPVDMHALPFEMMQGQIVQLSRPPLFSKEPPREKIILFSPRLLRASVPASSR